MRGNGKVLLAEAGKHYVTGAASSRLNALSEDDLACNISLHRRRRTAALPQCCEMRPK